MAKFDPESVNQFVEKLLEMPRTSTASPRQVLDMMLNVARKKQGGTASGNAKNG